MNKMVWIGAGVIVAASASFFWLASEPNDAAISNAAKPDAATPIVSTAMHGEGAAAPAPDASTIIVPTFSQAALSGEQFFGEFCSACHGENAAGTDQGPPLIHQLYVPGHHGDAAIKSAALNGVTSHHWRFGNMPPVPGIEDAHIRWITTYLRELQVANGFN